VWQDVAETVQKLGGASSTGALDMAYAANDGRLKRWLASFHCDENQIGLLAFVADRPLGMDVIGAPRLYERLHDRLLRGYVLDGMEHAADSSSPETAVPPAHAQQYLNAVRAATRTPGQTVGRGTYGVLSGAVVGGELTDGPRLAHLSAFPTEQPHGGRNQDDRDEPIVAPPSRRRTHGGGTVY
jgi:hypothetical protein